MDNTLNRPKSQQDIYYGGQAVIEGVMIRGPEHMAIAIRNPEGTITKHTEQLKGIATGRLRNLAFIRGILVLWETLSLGTRALLFSSKIAYEEVEENGEIVEFPAKARWGAMLISLAMVTGIFFVAPVLISNLLDLINWPHAVIVITEALLRIIMFIGYIALISLMPDIKRVFQYHGAEHMTIHAYENGKPIDIKNIRSFPKEHTRCGTSFLLVVIVLALVIFILFDLLVDEGLIIRIISRIILLPPIAALSYEILRIGARFEHTKLIKILFTPNIALQKLTTRSPEDAQIEVAIEALNLTLDITREKSLE